MFGIDTDGQTQNFIDNRRLSEMNELKNCPFCGSRHIYHETPCTCQEICAKDWVKVRCIDCCASVRNTTKDKAITLWNHRPIEDQLRKALEELLEHHVSDDAVEVREIITKALKEAE